MALSRRLFILGAPAIVASASLMKIKPLELLLPDPIRFPYKGLKGLDAGFFYCPYIPLQFSDGQLRIHPDYVPNMYELPQTTHIRRALSEPQTARILIRS
jgi:hypothetical protein